MDNSSELIRLENNVLTLRVERLLMDVDDLTRKLTSSERISICLQQRISYLEDRASRADASYSSTIAAMRLRFSNDLSAVREQLSPASCKLAVHEPRLSKAHRVCVRLKSKNLALSEELFVLASEHKKYLELKRQLLNPLVVLRFFFLSIQSIAFRFLVKTLPLFRS